MKTHKSLFIRLPRNSVIRKPLALFAAAFLILLLSTGAAPAVQDKTEAAAGEMGRAPGGPRVLDQEDQPGQDTG